MNATDETNPAAPAVPATGPSSLRRRLGMVALTLALFLLAAEVAIRTRDAVKGYGFFNNNRNTLVKSFRQLIPFRTFGIRPYQTPGVITGRHGQQYPIQKAAGTFRIVCFGGSTTECYYEGNTKGVTTDYPIELQKRLRSRLGRDSIEVINLGHSSYATPHLLAHLTLDAASWSPDLVIVSENMNDLLVNWFPDFKPDYSNAYATPFFAMPDFTTTTALLQHMQIYWIVRNTYLKQQRRMRRRAWGDAPLPGLDIFKRNLRSFAGVAKAHGIRVLMATQPSDPRESMFDLHHGFKPYNNVIYYPLHAEFLRQHALYNAAIEEVARETGSLFVDSHAALEGHPEYFIDHVHYTDAGVARLADNYADFLIRNEIVK